jgi:hypothetical protein
MALPQLEAVSPVLLDIVETGKTVSVPLVSFEKKDNMVVNYDGSDLTLVYNNDRKLYIGTIPRGDSRVTEVASINPSWRVAT